MSITLARATHAVQNSVSAPTQDVVIHFLTLRKAIGFVGLALPFVLIGGENLRDTLIAHATNGGRELIELSISAYFHTGMRDVFVGSLCAIGVFLICYNGYQRLDNILANLAGWCAILVAFCPTFEASREAADAGVPIVDSVTIFSGPNAPDPPIVGYLHFSAATVFFVSLAVISLFLFTKSSDNPTPEKVWRNRVYRVCGITILGCIAGIAAGKLFLSYAVERKTSYVFWLETLAIIAFSVSWLVKGEVVLKDTAGKSITNDGRTAQPAR